MRCTRFCDQHTSLSFFCDPLAKCVYVYTSITTLNCHFCTSCFSGSSVHFIWLRVLHVYYITHYYNNKMHIFLTIFIWNQSVIQLSQQPIQMIWQWVSSYIYGICGLWIYYSTTSASHTHTTHVLWVFIWYLDEMDFSVKRKEMWQIGWW